MTLSQADKLSESLFDILDREADNSDSLEVQVQMSLHSPHNIAGC